MNEEYLKRPDKSINYKPVRMMFEFIGQQANPLPNKKRITLKDIEAQVKTKKQFQIYTQFTHAQFELITLYNRVLRLIKVIDKTMESIKKYDDEHTKFIFYMDFKEAYVISTILEQLGIVWNIEEFKDLGKNNLRMLADYQNKIETIERTGIKFNEPLITDEIIKKMKKDLTRIDILAPLLVGYYQYFANYEKFTRLDYDKEER